MNYFAQANILPEDEEVIRKMNPHQKSLERATCDWPEWAHNDMKTLAEYRRKCVNAALKYTSDQLKKR